MKTICVIGDSHTGSLKRAWDKIGSGHPDIEITFFAARGFAIGGMEIQGGNLVPNSERLRKSVEYTSGGKSYIDTGAYDSFLIYGLGALANFENTNAFFSSQAINLARKDLVCEKPSFKMLERLRKITKKPVFIGHFPLEAAEKVTENNNPVEYVNGVASINKAIYNPMGSELISQPSETIVNGNETHPDFSKGSMRLSVGEAPDNEIHPEYDRAHMNDHFGEVWLEGFFKKI